MAVSHQFRPIIGDDSKEYRFNAEKLKTCYEDMAMRRNYRGVKGAIVAELANRIGCSESNVLDLIRGKHGPNPEAVSDIANYFGISKRDFLMPVSVGEDMESKDERVIPSYERNAARDLYHKLCDMAEGMCFLDPTISMKYGLPTTKEGFRYLGPTQHPFEYRDNLILAIRKASFDLPRQLCDELKALVMDAFTDDCGEDGMLYLSSDGYREYLCSNGLDDSEDAKELYSINYVRNLFGRLEELFEAYMQV